MAVSLLSRFRADRSASVAVMAALSATVLIAVTAFAVDAGKMFIDRRKAQSATDLAALSAAISPANASVLAQGTVSQNGMKIIEPLTIITGNYTADPQLTAEQRFSPGPAATADAVQVVLTTDTPVYFGRLLGGSGSATIRTTATAANTAIASFAIGSRLLGLDGGVLNQLLSNALGGSISLTVMDYRSLADLKVNAFDYLDALATTARITGPTYDSVLNADIAATDAISALATLTSQDASVKSSIAGLLVSIQRVTKTTTKINLGSALNLGPYNTTKMSEHPVTGVSLSALDIINAVARLADGTNQAAAAIGLTLPQLASANVKLTIGERPVGSGWTAVGRTGASVQTAQTRLKIDVAIAPVGLSLINLPIYIDVAKAKAKLTKLTCPGPTSQRTAKLAVTPAVAEAWIGDIPKPEWESMGAVSSPSAANLLSLGILQVTAKAHVRVGNQTAENVSFSSREIDEATVKTVVTKDYLNSLTGSLIGDLELGIGLGKIGIILPGQKKLITDALSAVAQPIDSIVYTTLAYLGVGIGEADVWVDGLRCDVAVLVN